MSAIRFDTLGMMLHMANINSESKTLIMDNSRGLLTRGVLERTSMNGKSLLLSLGDSDKYDKFNELPAVMKSPHLSDSEIKIVNYPNSLIKDSEEQKEMETHK